MGESMELLRRDFSAYYDKGSTEAIKVTKASSRKIEERRKLSLNSSYLLIVLVGLPGRGKSFIARKLQNYLNWLCIPCKTFNAGKYRREADPSNSSKADFFDKNNESAMKLREEIARMTLTDALEYLGSFSDTVRLRTRFHSERGCTAIFDATNSTRGRRDVILNECAEFEKRTGKPIGVVFIETICNDKELLEENLKFKVTHSPDYHGVPLEDALDDIRERVSKYEEQYETITDDSLSYIKIFNLSSKLLANLIYGRTSKIVVPALMAWHVGHRPIYLCRSGKTEENCSGDKRLDRCGRLDAKGIQFRGALYDFIRDDDDGSFKGKIMCSTMPRSVETVMWDGSTLDVLSCLNPLDKGDFTGMELSDIKKQDPVWYSQLEKDAYNTRFPGGECYHDLIARLEPCIIDIEQQVIPVLVVSHVSVLQVLLSYFRNTPVEKCASIKVPMHTVIKLIPSVGGGWSEYQYPLIDEVRDSDCSLQEREATPIWTDADLNRFRNEIL